MPGDPALHIADVDEHRGAVRARRLAIGYLADPDGFRPRVKAAAGELEVVGVHAEGGPDAEKIHGPRAFPSSHSRACASSVNTRPSPPRLVATISPNRSGWDHRLVAQNGHANPRLARGLHIGRRDRQLVTLRHRRWAARDAAHVDQYGIAPRAAAGRESALECVAERGTE
jgi:hypothetical protein